MGNDGGTIARGQDLRAVYASGTNSAGQNHIDNLQHSLLSVCSLSSLPLYEQGHGHAVVSDYLGKLYLKEKVLEFLLRKKSQGIRDSKLPHINGLGDLIDMHITWSADGSVICPVSKTTKTQKSTFAYLRPCGCVISSRVLQDLRNHRKISELLRDADATDECPHCSTMFVFNYDMVMLNPEQDAELEAFNKRNYSYLVEELRVGHAKKRLKKERRERREKAGKKSSGAKVGKP